MYKTLIAFLLLSTGLIHAMAHSPVVFYLKNLPSQRIGIDADDVIIKDLQADGFLVFEIDCSLFPQNSPALENRLVEFHLSTPAFLKKHAPQNAQIDFGTILYVPAGYRVARDIPVWNILKHGPPRIQDFILRTYNTAIAKKYKIKPVKTAVEMVAADGKPLDYNLYMDFIYPSGAPSKKVPLLLNFSSNAPRFFPFSPIAERDVAYRAIFPIGFLTSGYAFANLDHCFIPVAKRGVYGHVQPYSLDKYTAVAYVTSALRYIRSVAGKYNLNGRIGAMGISKASYSAVIAANVHNDRMPEAADDYGAPAPNQPYQGYSSKIDVAYAASGDGTWRIPDIIDEDSVPLVTSMGKRDKFTRHWTHYPVLLTHLDKMNNIHLDFWMEELGHTYPGPGTDFATGLPRYSLFKTFFDRILKPDEHIAPAPLYILPKDGAKDVRPDGTFRVLPDGKILPSDLSGQTTDGRITVRFLSEMDARAMTGHLQIIHQKKGALVPGTWAPFMKNTSFRFTPRQPLEAGETYVIKVLKNAPDKSGNKTTTDASRTFTVNAPP